jgi:hypothetical protein
MPPELKKTPEENFNPADELKSFTQQLSKMKKEVSSTVKDMSKEIGTGLIDMSLVKQQFKKLETYIGKQSDATLKGYRKRIGTFIQEQKEIVRQLQKDSVTMTLIEQQKTLVKSFQDIYTEAGTLEFPDAFERAKESAKETLEISEQLIQKAVKDGILKTSAIKKARETLEFMKGEVYLKEQQLEKVVAINDQLTAARDAIGEMVDTSFAFFDKIPGGEYFKTALGLDKIKEDIKKNVGVALSQSIGQGINTTGALKVAMQGVVSTYLSFAKMLLFNPWTLAIIGIVLLIKQFADLEAAGEDFRRSTGLTLALTQQLTPQIESAALSMRKYGVTVEDAYNASAALYSKFQNIQVLTPTLIKTVALMEAKLGVSNENAAQVLETFMAMKDVSKDTIGYWIDTTSQLSHAAGVAPADVFSDIAGNSELIATYMGASVEEIIKTAVNARKLGLELEDVGSIIDSAMDWESSIEKELEASILLGRQINFNAARQKAFQGDIDGAAKEVLNQVGTLDDFNNMNYIQKKAIADATGLTVAKLQESLSLQKKLNDLTPEQRIQYEAGQKELEQINSTVTDLKNSFMAIGASLGRVVLPVINVLRPAVKQIADVVAIIADGINSLVDGMDKIIPGSKTFASHLAAWPLLIFAAKKPLGGLMGMLGKAGKMIGGKKGLPGGNQLDLFDKGAGVGKGAVNVSKSTSFFEKLDAKKMLAGAAAILIISGALWVFAKALQQFAANDDLVGSMIAAAIGLGILTAAVFALGTFMSSGVGALAIIAGAAAMAVMAGALWILGAAINQFVPMVDTLLRGIGVIVEVIGDAITKVVSAVADSFVKLSGLGSGLAMTAVAIWALTGAFAAFIAVSTTGSFATMFSGLFGDSPIDQLERLALIGPGLMLTANALKQFTGVPEISTAGIEGSVELATSIGGIGSVITESNDKINKKLDEVIAAVKDINVYMDGRKVNETIARNTSTSKLT